MNRSTLLGILLGTMVIWLIVESADYMQHTFENMGREDNQQAAKPTPKPRRQPPRVQTEADANSGESSRIVAEIQRLEFLELLNRTEMSNAILAVGRGANNHELRLEVQRSWHSQPYDVRLKAAQVLWQAWAEIHSPDDHDLARVQLVDSAGNEVGGSRDSAGSRIWVHKSAREA